MLCLFICFIAPPFFPGSTSLLNFLYLLFPSGAGARGLGVVVSSSHVVSVTPSFSKGGFLTLFPCSSMGSLPQETVLHELLQCGSFPQAEVNPKMLQCGSILWAAVLQEWTTPAWVPQGVTSPASKSAPAWAPLSPRGDRSYQELAPARASHRVTACFGHTHLLRGGVPSTGCRWISAPLWTSVGCRRTACLTMVFSVGCRGMSFPELGLTRSHSSLQLKL